MLHNGVMATTRQTPPSALALTTAPRISAARDPLFALIDAAGVTRADAIAAGLDRARWGNLRRGYVRWTNGEIALVAPLVGRTSADLHRLLGEVGYTVRRDGEGHGPQNCAPRPRRSRRQPSGTAPDRAA